MEANLLLRAALVIAAVCAIVAKLLYHVEIDLAIVALGAVAIIAIFVRRLQIKEMEIFGVKFGIEQEQAPSAPATSPVAINPRPAPTAQPGPSQPDQYLARLMKLTPTETIMAYLVTLRMLQSSKVPAFGLASWITFGVFLILTSVYVASLRARVQQVVLSTLVFAAWAFAMGGPFDTLHWYDPAYSALGLVLVSLIGPLLMF